MVVDILGHGKMIYVSGNRYEGEWKNDMKHGKGTTYYASGNRYEANWKNNKQMKNGVFYSKS